MADLSKELSKELNKDFAYCEDALGKAENAIGNLPSVQPEKRTEERMETHACDLISRQAAIDAVDSETVSTNPEHFKSSEKFIKFMDDADIASFGKWQWANGFNTALVATTIQLKRLPSAQLEKRYTEEELRVFQHGISLSLLSKRSSQHWQYDEDTATEIEFLERLYDKVSADMKGEQ